MINNYQNQFSSQYQTQPYVPNIPTSTYTATEYLRHRLVLRQMIRSGYYTPYDLIFDPSRESGIYFGKNIDGFAIGKKANYDGHAIIFGASGAGKTTSIGIPTICAWPNPIFAIDLKGDLIEWGKGRNQEILYLLGGKKNEYYYEPFDLLKTCTTGLHGTLLVSFRKP